jgi:hypothetical protein
MCYLKKVISHFKILLLLFVFLSLGVLSSTVKANTQNISVEIVGTLAKTIDTSKYTLIGGNFNKIRVTSLDFLDISYLAIIDRSSSNLSDRQIVLDGPVNDIEISGGNVYVGGEFRTVNGNPQPYLFIIDATNLQLVKNQVAASTPIKDIAISNNNLSLKTINGLSESIIIQKNDKASTVPITIIEDVIQIDFDELGFQPPNLGDIITFAIRIFFVISGLTALFYMLLGAFSWVTSGGNEEAVTAARNKIQSAVVGLIMIVVVLAIIWTLEQAIFQGKICLGLSCPLTLPVLLK